MVQVRGNREKITIYSTVISTDAGDKVVEQGYVFSQKVSRLVDGLFDPNVAYKMPNRGIKTVVSPSSPLNSF